MRLGLYWMPLLLISSKARHRLYIILRRIKPSLFDNIFRSELIPISRFYFHWVVLYFLIIVLKILFDCRSNVFKLVKVQFLGNSSRSFHHGRSWIHNRLIKIRISKRLIRIFHLRISSSRFCQSLFHQILIKLSTFFNHRIFKVYGKPFLHLRLKLQQKLKWAWCHELESKCFKTCLRPLLYHFYEYRVWLDLHKRSWIWTRTLRDISNSWKVELSYFQDCS